MKQVHHSFALKILGIPSTCMLIACTTMDNARQGAGLMSAYTVDLQNQMTVFSDSRLKINQLRLMNINVLEENSIDTKQRNLIEVGIWEMKHIGSKTKDLRVLFYQAIRASTEAAAEQQLNLEQLQAERSKTVREMKTAIKFDAEKLAKVSKNLADLAKEENTKEQMKFLIGFSGEVRKSIKKLEEDAKKQAELAKKSAEVPKN